MRVNDPRPEPRRPIHQKPIDAVEQRTPERRQPNLPDRLRDLAGQALNKTKETFQRISQQIRERVGQKSTFTSYEEDNKAKALTGHGARVAEQDLNFATSRLPGFAQEKNTGR